MNRIDLTDGIVECLRETLSSNFGIEELLPRDSEVARFNLSYESGESERVHEVISRFYKSRGFIPSLSDDVRGVGDLDLINGNKRYVLNITNCGNDSSLVSVIDMSYLFRLASS